MSSSKKTCTWTLRQMFICLISRTLYPHPYKLGVLNFLSSRPHWDSPTPSPAGECVPPPLVQVGYTLACGRVGGGVPIQTREQALWNRDGGESSAREKIEGQQFKQSWVEKNNMADCISSL